MGLLEQAKGYYKDAGVSDIQDINNLKGMLSIEYAKCSSKAVEREREYNLHRAEVYKSLILDDMPTTKCSELAKSEAEVERGDYIVYKQQAKSIAKTIDQLRDIVIGIQYVDKHLSAI